MAHNQNIMEIEAIEAARLRLCSAKKWHASASRTLEFAKFRVASAQSEVESSHKELEDACAYLMGLGKKYDLFRPDEEGGEEEDAMIDNTDVVESPDNKDGADDESSYAVRNMMMQIFVRGFSADGTDELVPLDVNPSDTIAGVKAMIEVKTDVPSQRFYLSYAGKFLEDERTLADYKIRKKSTVQFYFRRT